MFIFITTLLVLQGGDMNSLELSPKTKVELQNDLIGSVRTLLPVKKVEWVVLDSRTPCLRFFSKDGEQLRKIGRKGQGPGEFDSPTDIAYDNKHLYVSDPIIRKIHIFSIDTYEYIKSIPTIDGHEIHLSENQIILSAPHLETDTSLHWYEKSGKKVREALPIPKITKDHQLISSGISFDISNSGQIVAIHEMQNKIFSLVPTKNKQSAWNIHPSFYKPPPEKIFDDFHSRKRITEWLYSWTHLQKIRYINNDKHILVSMVHLAPEYYIVHIYSNDGQFLNGFKLDSMRFLESDASGNLYFLDEKTAQNSEQYQINIFELTVGTNK